MTILCKRLRQQTEQGAQFFEEEAKSRENSTSTPSAPTDSKSSCPQIPYNPSYVSDKDEDNIDSIFCLKEVDVEVSCNSPFKLSWQNIIYALEPNRNPNQPNQSLQHESTLTLSQKKEHYSRTAKNLFLFVENVLIIIKEL